MENLIDAIKQISIQANEASDPVRIIFGKVMSAKPLKISIGQRIIIEGGRLFLCSNVIEKETEEIFDIYTETANGGGTNHSHRIYGKKKIIINNGLKEGEKVILLQMQGGQKFLVLDRVVEESGT